MRSRAFATERMSGEIYHDFMDAGFRRSGQVFYQPVCSRCRDCIPIRVPTRDFLPTKSQRRVWRRNQDLRVHAGAPTLSEEKFELYLRYLDDRHGRGDTTYDDLERFLYHSPVDTVELEYRNEGGRIMGVSILDVCNRSLSSVYMYFDPEEARRSPGVYSALFEIAWAREHEIDFYYLGFWVKDCPSMSYKADYTPHEILRTDGLWLR